MTNLIQRDKVYTLPKSSFDRSYPIEADESTFPGKKTGLKIWLWIPAHTYVEVVVTAYLDAGKVALKVRKLDFHGKITDTFTALMDRDEFAKMVEPTPY